MPIQNYLAGMQPLGGDLPEVANMLLRKRTAEQEMGLRQRDQALQEQRYQSLDQQAGQEQQLRAQLAEIEMYADAPPEVKAQYVAIQRQKYPEFANTPFATMPPEQAFEGMRKGLYAKMGMQAPEKEQPYSVQFQPGPYGSQIATDGKRFQIVEPPKPQGGGQRDAPSGYEWDGNGGLRPITGGPADPSGPGARKNVQPLRKEFEGLDSVKSFKTSLPLLVSARKAPDNGYGDLQLIYTAGKILDPGSVVREGELALTVAAGSPLQRIIGATRFTTENGGRLTAQTRQQILEMLNERVLAYRQAYDQDRERFGSYATEAGGKPADVIGPHPANAYSKPTMPNPDYKGAKPQTTLHKSGARVTILPPGQ